MPEFCVVANGPFLEKDLLIKSIAGKTVLALDGAANVLRMHNITPNIILGDFDSIDLKTKKYYGIKPTPEFSEKYLGNHGTLIVPALDQNYTDLEKAVQYCCQQSSQDITIICASGGREDHHESLKFILKEYYNPYQRIIAHSNYGSMCYVKNEKIYFYGKSGDNCGFVLDGLGEVISEGLLYQCQGQNHSFANKMLSRAASFDVQGAALIFLPKQIYF